MITLNDLMTLVDARQLRVIVPVTPRLKALIAVNPRQITELDDVLRIYGDYPVFSAEPAHGEAGVMEIELQRPDRVRLAIPASGTESDAERRRA